MGETEVYTSRRVTCPVSTLEGKGRSDLVQIRLAKDSGLLVKGFAMVKDIALVINSNKTGIKTSSLDLAADRLTKRSW